MSHEMFDLLRSNSPGHPIGSQAEQHSQPSEIVHYLRGLNQWLEQDANERRAHLEQTQNKVIPLLNRIVQDMDLRREGGPLRVVRSPLDGQQDVIASYPMASTVSAVFADRASSSTFSSSSRNHPRSRQYAPLLEPTSSHPLNTSHGSNTLAPSLGKTVMTPSNATEVETRSPEHTEILGQNDIVHTQLQTFMKSFAEHRNEVARKHELAEECWEDKLAKDAATHNMLERILANQAEIMGKFATFKDEVLAEFQKIRVPNTDHGIPEHPSLDPGPRAPSRSSSPTQGPTAYVPSLRQPGVLPLSLIPATITPNGNSTGHHLPPDLEPITIEIPLSLSRSPSPAHAMPLPATIIPAVRVGSRSPPRTHSPSDLRPRPRSPYDSHRPRSPYHRPRSPYSPRRPRSPYDPYQLPSPYDLGPYRHRPRSRSPYDPRHRSSRRNYYGPPRPGYDPYEDEWRRRPRFRSLSRYRPYGDYEYYDGSRAYSSGYRRLRRPYRPYRSRSRDSWLGYPSSRAYSRPRSPEYVDRLRRPRYPHRRPRSRSPEYEDNHRDLLRRPVSLRSASRSRSGSRDPDSESPHAAVPVPSGPSHSRRADTERERQVRFANETIDMLDRTAVDLQDPEEECEEYYSANEEEEERISIEDERRRNRDAGHFRKSLWKKLRDRLRRVRWLRPSAMVITVDHEPSTSPTPTAGSWTMIRRWPRRS